MACLKKVSMWREIGIYLGHKELRSISQNLRNKKAKLFRFLMPKYKKKQFFELDKNKKSMFHYLASFDQQLCIQMINKFNPPVEILDGLDLSGHNVLAHAIRMQFSDFRLMSFAFCR